MRLGLLMLAMLAAGWPAMASAPVKYKGSACILDGFAISTDRSDRNYQLRLLRKTGSGDETQYVAEDLAPLEGKAIAFNGWLGPGYPGPIMLISMRVVGPCAGPALARAMRELPAEWAGRAHASRRRGDLPSALAAINRAITLDPARCHYDTRADILAALGRLAEAGADLQRVLALDDCRSEEKEAAKSKLLRIDQDLKR
jgi:tetratricopeptide (TPR) repeat protein